MINKIMPSASSNTSNVSFGFAKLSKKGAEAVKEFGIDRNCYLDEDMFEKQGFMKKPKITEKLKEESFNNICSKYGCSENAGANAAFIKSQILSKKAGKSINFNTPEHQEGLINLYNKNYDNPLLSSKETQDLLDKCQSGMPSESYYKLSGIMTKGTLN